MEGRRPCRAQGRMAVLVPARNMLSRAPDLPDHMGDGLDNPLGTRALYLYQGDKDTLFHIHGTNEPETIGKASVLRLRPHDES